MHFIKKRSRSRRLRLWLKHDSKTPTPTPQLSYNIHTLYKYYMQIVHPKKMHNILILFVLKKWIFNKQHLTTWLDWLRYYYDWLFDFFYYSKLWICDVLRALFQFQIISKSSGGNAPIPVAFNHTENIFFSS